jgi:hypothetical protein
MECDICAGWRQALDVTLAGVGRRHLAAAVATAAWPETELPHFGCKATELT